MLHFTMFSLQSHKVSITNLNSISRDTINAPKLLRARMLPQLLFRRFSHLRKATISVHIGKILLFFYLFVLAVCLSVCLSVSLSAWNFSAPTELSLPLDFREISYINIFRKSVYKTKISLKSDKNNGYFTRRPIYICDNMSPNSSSDENFSDKVEEEIKTHILRSITFFF